MKLTTKGRYAVMAMADLASYARQKPISLTEISLRQNISLSYLEQLFLKLKICNLVKSVRGANGGYTLVKPASEIKLSNIIYAVDETVKTLNCKKESKKGIAIKKFLFWKSNKEKTSDYPSYLCYYLDYSEGRSDPIKRKLYPFEDEKLGLNHFKNLVSENIKKGWEKHGA